MAVLGYGRAGWPLYIFRTALAAASAGISERARVWHYLSYDQLSRRFLTVPPSEAGVVLVESVAKASNRPYHQQKLAYILANQRHFALELAQQGVAVRYVAGDAGYAEALGRVVAEIGPLQMAEGAERELRVELAGLILEGRVRVHPHPGWLTSDADWDAAYTGKSAWKMDVFYRQVRQRSGLLMQDGLPEGGRFSFDADNRQPWRGTPSAPAMPCFEPDAVTLEVGALIEQKFGGHPGKLDLTTLPATHADAERLWAWALAECLPRFGPFEDAMSTRSRGLFHSRISPLLNLHRLWPARVVADVAGMAAPLASREGFVRQILGWREFVRHVHFRTDGFRDRWPAGVPDRGAEPHFGEIAMGVPPALWGTPSGLNCLDEVVRSVWDEGYSHHITRLMIVGNLMTLLGVSPRELADWFWVAYVDAYDWVVEPNVLGMATFGDDRMTTKPYVSGSTYIAKMSDYCSGCAFDPKSTCPITPMYWAFLAEHREALRKNPRTAGPVASLLRRSPEKQAEDEATRTWVRETLAAGTLLTPERGEAPGLFRREV